MAENDMLEEKGKLANCQKLMKKRPVCRNFSWKTTFFCRNVSETWCLGNNPYLFALGLCSGLVAVSFGESVQSHWFGCQKFEGIEVWLAWYPIKNTGARGVTHILLRQTHLVASAASAVFDLFSDEVYFKFPKCHKRFPPEKKRERKIVKPPSAMTLDGYFQGYTEIIQFNRVFPYKPSILGYPYFRKHPDGNWHFWGTSSPNNLSQVSSKDNGGWGYLVPQAFPPFWASQEVGRKLRFNGNFREWNDKLTKGL